MATPCAHVWRIGEFRSGERDSLPYFWRVSTCDVCGWMLTEGRYDVAYDGRIGEVRDGVAVGAEGSDDE